MLLIVVGSVVALSSLLLMRSSDNLMIFAGMFMLIMGIFLIKKGREKIVK